MRVTFVVIAFLLASCGGQDSNVSRITGEWRSSGVSPIVNSVDMTLNRDGKTVTGFSDVNNVIYDLNGRWSGSLTPDEVLKLDIAVMVTGLRINGDGTISTGAEEGDVVVVGHRTGRSFDLRATPEHGEALQLSGQIDYNFKHFQLQVEIKNIPVGPEVAARRDLQLTIEGKSKGGLWNLFRSAFGSDASSERDVD